MLQYCDRIISPRGEVTELSEEEKERIRKEVIDNFAAQGLRTICLAYGDFEPRPNWEEAPQNNLICIGIVGIKVFSSDSLHAFVGKHYLERACRILCARKCLAP